MVTLSFGNSKEAAKYGIDEDFGMIMYLDFGTETMTMKESWAADNKLGAVVPGHETESIKQLHAPDNITVSPWGSVLVTEDGDNPCSLVAYSDKFGSREIARDLGDRGEWAGPCFSKSGNVLFASIQGDCTYAITGPLGRVMN